MLNEIYQWVEWVNYKFIDWFITLQESKLFDDPTLLVWRPVSLSVVYLYVCLCLSVCRCLLLSVCLCSYVSMCLCVYMCVNHCVCLSVCLLVVCLAVGLYVSLSLSQSVYISWSGDEMWTWKHPYTFLSWIAQSYFWGFWGIHFIGKLLLNDLICTLHCGPRNAKQSITENNRSGLRWLRAKRSVAERLRLKRRVRDKQRKDCRAHVSQGSGIDSRLTLSWTSDHMQFMGFLREICGLAALWFRAGVTLFSNPYRLSQKVTWALMSYIL